MLDKVLAEKFMERIRNFTDYNVNLMDERGIIIASKDEKRVGTFHEIAYRILQGEEEEISVTEEDRFLGVKEGVNMAILESGKRIGVIGITGDTLEIKPIALVMKMAIETMLEYEHYKDGIARRKNEKERFMNLLLYGGYQDKNELYRLAQRLKYKRDCIRIPVYIELADSAESTPYSQQERLLDRIKNSPLHKSQDISFLQGEGHILIFKTLETEAQEASFHYKNEIKAYIESFAGDAGKLHAGCRYFAGSLQNCLENYKMSFRHCQWLKDNCPDNGKLLFFYDHVDEYIGSLAPAMELHGIFNVFYAKLDGDVRDALVELAEALDRNEYNLVKSSQDLFVHKNTLVFRLNKIRDLLNINPVQKTREREFLKYLSRYLRSRQLPEDM